MKKITWLMTFVVLFSMLTSMGCALAQRGLGQTPMGAPGLTLSLTAVSSLVGERQEFTATVTRDGKPVPEVEVRFEFAPGSVHHPLNLAPDESLEIEGFVWADPRALISEHWKKEKVYSNSANYVYCGTGASGEAKFALTGIKEGTDTIVVSATVDGYELKATATKTWERAAIPVPVLSLTPTTATNLVGSRHELIATVTRDGKTVPEVEVRFEFAPGSVHHPLNLAPDESLEIEGFVWADPRALISEHWKKEKVYSNSNNWVYYGTGPSGEAKLALTGIKEGTDTIVVSATVDGYELKATATKTWERATTPVPSISLSPSTATNTVGESHTVILTCSIGQTPIGAPARVTFSVSGAHQIPGPATAAIPASATTDSEGKAAFSYQGTKAGEDTITAITVIDGMQLTATATKIWVEPPPPPTPTLISPPNGSGDIPLTPTLEWSPSSGATSYELEMAMEPSFIDVILSVTISTTSYHIPSELSYATVYYWRVRACNDYGCSAWSEVWSFTTSAAPPP